MHELFETFGEKDTPLMPKDRPLYLSLHSLYAKVALMLLLSIIMSVLTYSTIFYIGKKMYVNNQQFKETAQESLNEAYRTLSEFLQSKENEDTRQLLDDWSNSNRYYLVYIVDENGSLLYSNDNFYALTDGDGSATIPVEKNTVISLDGKQESLTIAYLAIAEKRASIQLIAVFFAIIIGLFSFVLLLKQIIDRIKTISTKLEFIAGGDVNIDVYDSNRDEIGVLAQNIDAMKQSLVSQSIQLQNLEDTDYLKIAALSHDIKTPLTVVFGYLDIMRSKVDDPELLNYFDRLENKAKEIQDISTHLFDSIARKPLSQHLQPTPVSNPKTTTSFVIEDFITNLKLTGYTLLESDPIPQLNATFPNDILQQILTSLHANIMSYADEAFPISISTTTTSSLLVLRIQNAIRHGSNNTHATHVGMKLSQKLMIEYSGNLSYTSQNDIFTTYLSIPIISEKTESI